MLERDKTAYDLFFIIFPLLRIKYGIVQGLIPSLIVLNFISQFIKQIFMMNLQLHSIFSTDRTWNKINQNFFPEGA